MRTLTQKVDVELKDARVGWEMEEVKNAYPSSESALKMRTLRQKVEARARRGSKMHTLKQKVRQKRVPSARKWGPKRGREAHKNSAGRMHVQNPKDVQPSGEGFNVT